MRPAPHATLPLVAQTQLPPTQLGAPGLEQTLPHAPQLAGLVDVLVQTPLQHD